MSVPSEQEHSRPTTMQRHPVADLLTDEQRARVAAVTFEYVAGKKRSHGRIAARMPNGRYVCPLGVAVGLIGTAYPKHWQICRRLDIESSGAFDEGTPSSAVRSFTWQADRAFIEPGDVKRMLGVES